jgi:hypothetical protein
VWIYKNIRPVVKITDSHKHLCVFGAVGLNGKQQLFRQYDKFNEDNFYNYLKQIHYYKFPKCYLFLDKAPQHYKSQKIRHYLENHKDVLIPVWLPPTASPEFMILEEYWNISKNDLLVCRYYQSFTDFTNKISRYFRTKRFLLNMGNYLLANVELEYLC